MKIYHTYRFLSILVLVVALCFLTSAFADDESDNDIDHQGTDGFDLSRPVAAQLSNSGAATHKIPINIPPGRAGMQPKLALEYNSYNRNGWIGIGWSIPFSGIQRNTRRGVDYDSFEFQIDGQELVPVDIDSQGNGEYKAKIEGSFTQFFYTSDTGWEMISKSGLRSYFGESGESRQADPDDSDRVFKWCLNKVIDTNYNYMTYDYEKDLGQIYLKQIDYTGNERESLAPKNSILFHTESDRSDRSEIYSTHFEVATAKRLKVIEVRALDDLVCAYEFKYGEDTATLQSLLESVQQYGSDSSVSSDGDIVSGSKMPESKFIWGEGENSFVKADSLLSSFGYDAGDWRISKHPRMMADVNGDGMSDVVGFGNKGVYVSFSTGSGFEDPQLLVESFGYITGGWRGHPRFMTDVNGDGKADVVGFGNKGVIVSLSTGNDFSSPKIWIGSYGNVNGGWNINQHPRMMADVNGDGLADVVGFGNKGVIFSKNLCARGHLIEKVETPSGAIKEFEYANSSDFSNDSEYPRPPFIVHPVGTVKVDDGNGVITQTTFQHFGGYFDFDSREFRGFSSVCVTDPDGTTTSNWYNVGDYDKHKIYLTEVRETADEDSDLIRKTLYDWQLRDEGDDSFFVYLNSKTDELYDGGEIIASSIEAFTEYDTVGNIKAIEVQNWDSLSDFETITKKYDYYNYGSDSVPMWRTTMESIEGATSGVVRQTNYQYTIDGRGNLEEKELVNSGGDNPVFTYQYDGYGNVISETDARGNTTETTYDTSTYTYPNTITYPQTSGVDHIEVYETYDYTVGKPTEFKDRNDQSTYDSYDPFGRLEQTDLPDGGQTLYVYDDHNFPPSVTKRVKEQEGSYIDTVTHFDGLDRKIQTASFGEDQKSIITQWQYDSKGRLKMVSGPFFGDGTSDYPQTPPTEYYFESTTYDLRDRPIQIESPDGQNGSMITEYIHDGLSTKIIDPDGYSKTETKDCLGRTIQVVEHWAEASDSTTQYEYNLADELVRVENTLGHESTIVYDTLGRKISMTDPDMGQWSYTYDSNGNLKTQTDAEPETITYDYDELNRVTSKTYSSGDPSVSYAYDDPEVDNSIGRLTSVSNSTATTEYLAYDSMGRIVEERKTISEEGAFTTQRAYDLSGKLLSHTFPGDGYQIAYQYYSGSNLLEQVAGASDSLEYVYCSDYSPKGKMGTLVHGNGAQTSHTYDPLSLRLTQINTTHNDDTLMDRSYLYTPGGDIEEITDGVDNITYTYTYDERHRLTSETSSDPSQSMTPAIIELQYNDTQHIHAVSDVAVFGVEKSYSYDSNGNMTIGPDLTDPSNPVNRYISYNSDNMPYEIRYSDSEITTFDYDGDGKRVMKQSPDGKKTLYIDDNYEVIDGVAHRYIFAGNLRVAMIKGSETYYFHKDHLGSSSVITEQDSSDTELSQYLPYGGQRGTSDISATDYKFTDQEIDSSTGLYNYDARLYDPMIGWFISPDSIWPDVYNPQSLNRYAYALNNPLIYIDPSGHEPADYDDGFYDWQVDNTGDSWGNDYSSFWNINSYVVIYNPEDFSSQAFAQIKDFGDRYIAGNLEMYPAMSVDDFVNALTNINYSIGEMVLMFHGHPAYMNLGSEQIPTRLEYLSANGEYTTPRGANAFPISKLPELNFSENAFIQLNTCNGGFPQFGQMNLGQAFHHRYNVDTYAFPYWIKYTDENAHRVVPTDTSALIFPRFGPVFYNK